MFSANIQELLNELIESNCIVIKKNLSGLNEFYIPYMMNDAVECYIKLENCTLTGAWESVDVDSVSMEWEMNEDWTIKNSFIRADYLTEGGIIFTQNTGDVCTIWFEKYDLVCELYNYGRLGHFWRPGNDSIRRLVYLIGTIYDKYKYLGRQTCNNIETEIMLLLGVTPLRAFSPIDDDFAVFYDTVELENMELPGIELLIKIAEKAGAQDLTKSLVLYADKLKKSKKISQKIVSQITDQLADNSNYKVIMEIEQRIYEGAKLYKSRDYDYNEHRISSITESRTIIDDYIKNLGYSGEYPEYLSQQEADLYDSITVYEQQPFVVEELEYEGVEFKLFLVYRNSVSGEEKLELYDSIL